MRRALLAVVLVLGTLAYAQEASAVPNILQGHEVTATMPDMVLVVTAARAGITWTGPLVLEVDGRLVAHVTLPMNSAKLPRQPWTFWDWTLAIGSAAVAGLAGYGLGTALH
jgi:hypothetical protein